MNLTPCTAINNKDTGKNYAYFNSARCNAKTRQGTLCQSPAIRNKKRCRMHGGKGSGAPLGSQNAFKHGNFTSETIERRKIIRNLIKESKRSLSEFAHY